MPLLLGLLFVKLLYQLLFLLCVALSLHFRQDFVLLIVSLLVCHYLRGLHLQLLHGLKNHLVTHLVLFLGLARSHGRWPLRFAVFCLLLFVSVNLRELVDGYNLSLKSMHVLIRFQKVRLT